MKIEHVSQRLEGGCFHSKIYCITDQSQLFSGSRVLYLSSTSQLTINNSHDVPAKLSKHSPGWPGNLVLGVAWLWRQEDISVYYNQWGILYPPLTLEWCKYVCVSVKFILGGTLHYNWRERWQSYNVILTWRVSLLWRNPIRDRSVYFETSNWESERHPRRQQRGTRRVFSESEQKYLRNKICKQIKWKQNFWNML